MHILGSCGMESNLSVNDQVQRGRKNKGRTGRRLRMGVAVEGSSGLHVHVYDSWTTAVARLVRRPFRRYGTTLGPLWGTVSSSPERCGRVRLRLDPSEDGTVPEKERWESVIELKVFIYESDSPKGSEGEGDQVGFR